MSIYCSDEIPKSILDNAKFILVGHHLLTNPKINIQRVTEVYTNKPIIDKARLPPNPSLVTFQDNTKSVASLITIVIKNDSNKLGESVENTAILDALHVLYAPIILSTEGAVHTTPSDLEALNFIEAKLSLQENNRKSYYNQKYSKDPLLGTPFNNIHIMANSDCSVKVALVQIPTSIQVCIYCRACKLEPIDVSQIQFLQLYVEARMKVGLKKMLWKSGW